MEIVGRSARNVYKHLASSAPPSEVKVVGLECWLIVSGMHHLGCNGASPNIEAANSFMKLSHDIVYLFAIQG